MNLSAAGVLAWKLRDLSWLAVLARHGCTASTNASDDAARSRLQLLTCITIFYNKEFKNQSFFRYLATSLSKSVLHFLFLRSHMEISTFSCWSFSSWVLRSASRASSTASSVVMVSL